MSMRRGDGSRLMVMLLLLRNGGGGGQGVKGARGRIA